MSKKIYISADLEGIGGIVSHSECYPDEDPAAYERAVLRFNKEVSVVVEAAFDAGATEIVVNDAHGPMTNLRQDLLPDRVQLLSGKPKVCAMAAGLDESFDAAFFIGYHAKAGTEKGVLAHTFHDKIWEVRVNTITLGEGGINAYYAHLAHQVPLIFASGDQAFCQELSPMAPYVFTVETKVGLGYSAALFRDEAKLYEDYRQQVYKAIKAMDSPPGPSYSSRSPLCPSNNFY